ncbi:MAG: hypothetical protein HOZ81_20420 [Streptomyces sp.]|nr:hypothetical protein [Streptomyces sp.]NUS89403.1 hypothetical protein [Streptomyces sp.]
MTTAVLAPPTPAPLPQVDLETRLVLASAAMDVRLDEAAAQFAIRTAHIDIDPVPDVTETIEALPLVPVLTPPPATTYSTPIANLLDRARAYIESRGLLQGALRDDADVNGARCPIGAIRLEAAGNRHLADDACFLLLEAIQRDFPDAETIPSWVDAQTSPAPVLLALTRAADLANDRNL